MYDSITLIAARCHPLWRHRTAIVLTTEIKKVERKDKLLIGWAIALGVIAGSMVPMYKGPQAHTDGWAEFRVHPTPIYVNANGYFYPKITINGIPIRLIVDTGATSVALSTEDARKIGINPQTLQPTHESSTPNGMLQTTEIILPEMIVEGIVLYNVSALCCITGGSLLGMSALKQLKVEMNNNWLTLSPKN